jgi:uncharacterized membrane protein YphA (DoxX/SURF4 family)
MTIDVAAIFLASSILTMLAAIVWVIAILVVNNLVHKYWKPINLYKIVDPENRFAHPQDLKQEIK